MAEIQMLDVRQLFPHPQNPRKQLNDLEELAKSIERNGVFQNLTVVPRVSEQGNPMGYTVIIGHRRLAAAKEAGLTHLPCVVVEMDEKEQLSTMLVENMQRSDLTVLEQAEGFQLMLDMGESVGSISDRSGFSQSTIRRRVKLLKLDREKLRQAELRGGTLEDYAKLDNIRDEAVRNRVLEAVGTRNFENEYQSALGEQKRKDKLAGWAEIADQWAERITSKEARALKFVDSYSYWNDKPPKTRKSKEGEKYYYVVCESSVDIYCTRKQEPEQDKALAEESAKKLVRRNEVEKRAREMNEACGRFALMRRMYVQKIAFQEHEWKDAVVEAAAKYLLTENHYPRKSIAAPLLTLEADSKQWEADVAEMVQEVPAFALLVGIYSSLDHPYVKFHDIERKDGWERLVPCSAAYGQVKLYEFMTAIGYEMCDEEQQLLDGSHKLFREIV